MADPVKLKPLTLGAGRLTPPVVDPTPASTQTDLAAPATADRLQFTRQTRAPFLQRYVEDNTSGIPLDLTTGLPSHDRFQLSLHRTEDDQRRYLDGKYGAGSARIATDGQWIVRTPGTNGPVDRVADPIGIDAGDWAELAAYSPEIIGGMIGFGAGRLLPLVGKVKGLIGGLRDVISSSAGAQYAGAIKDIQLRVEEGARPDVPEVVRSRAVSGAIDTLFSGTIGTGLGIARFMKNPWIRSRTDIQLNAIRAQKEVAEKYGIHISLTPAESTGSHMLGVEQARLEQVPGAAPVLKRFRAREQTGPMALFREVMLGGRVPDSDVVGRQAITALQQFTGASDASVDAARINLSKAALFEMEETAATQSLPERLNSHAFSGDAVRNRIHALKDEATTFNGSLFNKVKELGGDKPILPGDTLADEMTLLRKTLPPSFLKNTPTVSNEFVPANIRGMLDELEAGKGKLWKLTDLQQMRQSVYDDIGKGGALPGYPVHYLSKIGKALSKAIDDGVAKLPTGELRAALTAANKDYIDNVLPFGKTGIAEMFLKDGESGYVGGAVLGSHYTSGPGAADRWNTLKQFIGSDSLEGRAIKRMAFDDVIGGALEPGGQLLNGKEVLRRLASFKESSPDLYREMFGKSADELQRVAQYAIAGEKDVLPTHKVVEILNSGKGPTVTALRVLKKAEEDQAILYRNEILEGVRKGGAWDTSKIKPEDFVNRFADKASVPEIEQAMKLIESNPGGVDLAGDIRASALEKFLNRNSAVADIGEVMLRAERDKPMRALLGKEIFDDLHRYGSLQKAILTTREKSLAGALEKTTTMNLLISLPLRFVQKVASNKIAAHLLTNGALRWWALRQPGESSEAVTMLMLSSPEFLGAVSRSFGNDSEGIREAEAFLGAARRGLSESWAQRNASESGQPATTNAPTRLSPPTLMIR